MSARVIMFVAVAALAAATANAGTGCNPQATQEYRDCLRLVDSL
ncbi:MAG TPA: hypothetical protein VNO35_04435 [Steroidobacteraceae bacterium]|nr:hypothetical protein [Steroidobacteraceae bacterium]